MWTCDLHLEVISEVSLLKYQYLQLVKIYTYYLYLLLLVYFCKYYNLIGLATRYPFVK